MANGELQMAADSIISVSQERSQDNSGKKSEQLFTEARYFWHFCEKCQNVKF